MEAGGPGPSTAAAWTGAGRLSARPPDNERRYDAFVVRLWRDGASGRLLRAEVEHAVSGDRRRATGPPESWIIDQIRACLVGDGEFPDPADPT